MKQKNLEFAFKDFHFNFKTLVKLLLKSDQLILLIVYHMKMKQHLKTAEFLAKLFDSQFTILGKPVGIVTIANVIPGIGDMIAVGLSMYLVWIGVQMGLPTYRIIQMVLNIGINFFAGLVPVFGDLIYVFHKANLKNLAILRKYADRQLLVA